MAYGCRVPLFRREQEHHILVGAPNFLLGLRRDSHIQLGVRCPLLVVPCAMWRLHEDRWQRQPWRLYIPPIDLDVGAFPS
jgi:hypothetical protein